MASITILNLNDEVKTRLRVRAAEFIVSGRHFGGAGVRIVNPWAATERECRHLRVNSHHGAR